MLAMLAAGLAGCTAEPLALEGRQLIKDGRVEEGLGRLQEAAQADPRDFSYRTGLVAQRERALFDLLTAADADLAAGRDVEAEATFRRVLALDAVNPRAQAGLNLVLRVRRQRAEVQRAVAAEAKGQVELSLDLLNKVLVENPENREARDVRRDIQARRFKQVLAAPTLRSRYTLPINLEFRDAGLRQVFDALSKGSGINFIFDKEVRPDIRVSISVKDVLMENVIALLLDPNQLAGKVLNDNTLLIYPATPAKVRDYQDLVIRSFYLENADVKQTQSMIKTMLKTKDTFIDEKLNLLVIRDTPEVIKLAENLISVQDHAEAEVVLEIEVMEILRSRLLQLGLQFPDQFQFGTDGITGGPYTGTINLKNQVGVTNLLSNPRIRVRNREKAKVLIGNRIPVISSVVTPSATSPIITDTIQYLDVGLKLDIEPNIHMDGGVTMKVNLEVSTLGDSVTSRNGTVAFRVGTRNATTVLQLKDGETQTLMGLIQDDDIEKASRLPGLGDIPILGRLFSNTGKDSQKTEIVLSITPKIVRNVPRPSIEVAALWSGTEANYRFATPLLNPAAEPAPRSSGRAPGALAAPLAGTASLATEATQAGAASAATAAAAAPAPAALLTPAAATDALELSWRGPAQVKPGEEFTVYLEGSSNVALSGADLQLLFDPAMFTVLNVAEGEWLKGDGTQTAFSQRVDPASGRIYATLRRAAAGGVQGTGALLAVTLRAGNVAGPAQLHLATAMPAVTGGGQLSVRGASVMQLQIVGSPQGAAAAAKRP
jgi:general secretion pathway protein D